MTTLEIPLTRGFVALVDADDYEALAAVGKWFAHPGNNTFYARRNTAREGKKGGGIFMHTFLTGWGLVDHVNGDGLDNRRSNLRPADDSRNAMNRGMRSDNTSGFKGVGRQRLGWRARIQLGTRSIYLGAFDTPQEAARAYDKAAHLYIGEFARPNFPQQVSS